MVLRKPKKNPTTKELDDYLGQGGDTPSSKKSIKPDEEKKRHMLVVSSKQMLEIDKMVESFPYKVSRNSWISAAITEKIKRDS